jgi:hypothetical protein
MAFAIKRAKLELGTYRKIRGRKVRRVSSGDLQKSLYGKTFERRGVISVGFGSRAVYADFIHEGVNGTSVKVGSKYSFKKKNLKEGVVERWIRQKPIKLRDKDGKFIPMTDKNVRSAAYLIGRSIAKNGIVPLPFMRLGVEAAMKKYDTDFLKAISIDLDNEIEL